jgi:hypothetical protein
VTDLDVARRAVHRGLITADQLREAQQFAAGGRSLLSVLLDFGHLKPDDLLKLGDVPRPRVVRVFYFATVAAGLCAVSGAFWLLAARSEPEEVPRPPEAVAAPPPLPDQLADRALRLVRDVEANLDALGRAPADRVADLRRAAALMEEALPERDAPEDLLVLARARELLDEWERARALYLRVLRDQPEDPAALVGASRASLLLRDAAASRLYAEKACALSAPPAEAYFARGSALLALGDDAAAALDFTQACKADAGYHTKVAALRARRDILR